MTNPRFTGTPPLRVWRMDEMGASTIDWHAHEMGASAVNWHAVVHPRTGFVYVASNEGIFEFDGLRWRMIRLPRERAALNVVIAPDGQVWATGPGTMVMLEPGDPSRGERVGDLIARDVSSRLPPAILASPRAAPATPVMPNDSDAPAAPLDGLTDANPPLLETPEGVYLRLRHFLVRFDPNGRVDSWETPETTGQLWWSGGLHVSVQGHGVHRLENGRLRPIAFTGDSRVWGTVQRPDGSWLWLTATGPWLVQGESATPLGSTAARALLASEQIHDALPLPDGGSAYATSQHGLVVLDREGEIVEILDAERGLPGDRVNGLSLDHEGGLWLAMPNALVRVQHDSGLASHGLTQGLRGIPQELAVANDWIFVTHSDGLSRRDPASGRLEAVPGVSGLVNQAAPVGKDLLVAGEGLWSVAPGGAAVLCSDPGQRWTLSPGRTEPDTLYVSGRFNLSLARRNPPGDAKPWSIAFPFRAVTITGLDSVHDNGTGFVWMVGYPDRIVRRLDVRGGVRADAPITTFGPENGLPAMKETDKVLLVPTGGAVFVVRRQGGAWRWDEARSRFDPEPRLLRDGAGPNSVRSSATSGWLYFPSATPLFRRVVAGADGALASEDYPVPALAGIPGDNLLPIEAQHTLWITSQTGLVSFDFERKTHRPAAPPAATLRRVSTTEGVTLWVAPPFAAPPAAVALTLAPAQRWVRIEFTLPSFEIDLLGRGKLQFRSRASGIDRDWTPWSTESHRDLNNLPDGAVAFEVEARDALGRARSAGRLEFHVTPPWWRTTPARVGWSALGLALVSGLVWGRTRTLRRRNTQLEAIVTNRTEELRQSNLELSRLHAIERDEKLAARLAEEKARLEVLRYQLNPHFLFNTLTSICAQLPSTSHAARTTIERLTDFCQLTLVMPEEGGNPTLGQELEMLRAYLDIEQTRWRGLLHVQFACPAELHSIPVPSLLLLPLVENALKYGLNTNENAMKLSITAAAQGDALCLEVANTGKWMTPESRGAIPSHGIGHQNLRQRLRRHYPDRHTFTTESSDGWVRIRITLVPDRVASVSR